MEISGNRICFVENRDNNGSASVIDDKTLSGTYLMNAIGAAQQKVAERNDVERVNEVPVVSRKTANGVPGITRNASSVATNDGSSRVPTLIANDASSVTAQDDAAVVDDKYPADNSDHRPATEVVPPVEDLAAEAEVVARRSLHGSSQDVAQEPISVGDISTNSANSNSLNQDIYSSRPPKDDATGLRHANPLHLSRSFSCAAPQANTARSYERFRSGVFEINGSGNGNDPYGAESFDNSTAGDFEVGSFATEEVTLDALLGEYMVGIIGGPKLLRRSSKAKCIAPAYSRGLRQVREVVHSIVRRRSSMLNCNGTLVWLHSAWNASWMRFLLTRSCICVTLDALPCCYFKHLLSPFVFVIMLLSASIIYRYHQV